MKLFFAFFFSVFFYVIILIGFFYFLIPNKKVEKPEIVYIHQVITIKKKIEHKKIIKQKIEKIVPKKNIVKEIVKKKIEIKTKSDFSKGGENIKIDDIFSNISENVKTDKIVEKKTEKFTKKIGNSISKEISDKLSNIKSTQKVEIFISNVNGSKYQADYLQKEFYKKWIIMNIFEPNKEVDIQVSIQNGKMELYVIATNLDTIRLNDFIKSLKIIDTKKIDRFNAKFIFKSKLKE